MVMREKSSRIFIFWEPAENIPPYLNLCMKTWVRFLPEYEIIQLNYSNLEKWIGKGCFNGSLYKDYSLPKQADAIRCAVLRRWGGVWFDLDTLVTSENIRNLLRSEAEFTLLGRHIGFIVAQKNAKVLWMWELGIRLRLFLFTYRHAKIFKIIKKTQAFDRWDYLGNAPLHRILNLATSGMFKSIDTYSINALPEQFDGMPPEEAQKRYQDFYFSENHAPIDPDIYNGGLICLHNSWTPEKYKRMSEKEFLEQNIVLAKMLKHILQVQPHQAVPAEPAAD